jgi:hypothetical protein
MPVNLKKSPFTLSFFPLPGFYLTRKPFFEAGRTTAGELPKSSGEGKKDLIPSMITLQYISDMILQPAESRNLYNR